MTNRFWKLTLRDLFWLVLLVAMGVAWGVESVRLRRELSKLQGNGWEWSYVKSREVKPSSESLERSGILSKLRLLSNAELHERFKQEEHPRHEYQCILAEMVRRGMHAELEKPSRFSDGMPHPSILTAHCRAKQLPDPFVVQVKVPQTDEEGKPIDYPLVQVSIQNNDPSKKKGWWSLGGDYRGGRSERWRIELTDRHGKRAPDSNFSSMDGGGFLRSEDLDFGGDTQPTNLDAQCYVSPPASGRYRMQVIHSLSYIASERDLQGMIVWKSAPVDVIVDNQEAVRQFRVLAVPIVLAAMIGFGFSVAVWRNWQPHWRECIALGLAVVLAIAWFGDLHYLQGKLNTERPDAEANWTMRLAEKGEP